MVRNCIVYRLSFLGSIPLSLSPIIIIAIVIIELFLSTHGFYFSPVLPPSYQGLREE